MALFDIFKKKKNVPAPQPQTVILSAENPQEPIQSRQINVSKPAEGTYRLTFRDPYTGRSMTDVFSANTRLDAILDRMEKEGLTSFPRKYLRFPGTLYISPSGQYIRDIPGVTSGMTLNVDVYQASDKRLLEHPNFRKSYPLVFYRIVDNVCTEKIEFLCYGFELPEDVIIRMKLAGLLSGNHDYDMLYWPDQQGTMRTFDRRYMGRPAYLCDFDPAPERVFLLQEQELRVYLPDSPIMPPMYGCPAAAMPEQEADLKERSVDLLKFD